MSTLVYKQHDEHDLAVVRISAIIKALKDLARSYEKAAQQHLIDIEVSPLFVLDDTCTALELNADERKQVLSDEGMADLDEYLNCQPKRLDEQRMDRDAGATNTTTA